MPMNQPTQLKRGLPLWLLLFYGVGNILAAGICVRVIFSLPLALKPHADQGLVSGRQTQLSTAFTVRVR
jgi:hypothetical protein